MTRAILLLLSIGLGGCVTQSLALAAGERLRPTSPSAIELLDTVPARPHEAIGTVHAHCRTNWLAAAFNCRERSLREALRIRAGELGADAVVSIQRSSFWQIEWTDVHLRGKAIRWATVEPRSAGHLTVHRNVLLESRAAPLRAEAAKQLGEHLADDKESVLALSMATNDEELVVRQAARKALVRIFEARHPGEKAEKHPLEELEREAQARANQAGRAAIWVIRWLWYNVYVWVPEGALDDVPARAPRQDAA